MLAGTRYANVWEETAVAPPPVPPLEGSHAASVLVIGAGYLGLSAALHLAEAGVDVLVADAEMPGWGASGRNGGQVIPGLKYDPSELEVMFGRERGTRIWQFAGAAADFVLDLVARLALDCSARRATWIQGIHSEKAAARAQQRVDDWIKRGARVEYLDRTRVGAIAGTDVYLGAFADHRAAALQPLSYARELARAAVAAGARVRTQARIVKLEAEGAGWRAISAEGAAVRADTVVVATNAYADGLVPGLARSIVALNSLQIATAPIPASARAKLLPSGETLSDTRRVIRYYRLDDEGRLLLGAGVRLRKRTRSLRGDTSRATCARCFPLWPTFRSRIDGVAASRCMSTTFRACIGRGRKCWSRSAARVVESPGRRRWARSWRASSSIRNTSRCCRLHR